MAQFKAFTSSVEVNGETVLAVVDGMGARRGRALEILAEKGTPDPEPGRWYPQQAWLDAFRAIAEEFGPDTLFSIGRRIPENARFPSEIDSIGKALASLNAAYHVNHRGGGIGSYRFEKTGLRSGRMICKNPYPCDFDRGIVTAVAEKFRPADCEAVVVSKDESAPCRKEGADSCTYLVAW